LTGGRYNLNPYYWDFVYLIVTSNDKVTSVDHISGKVKELSVRAKGKGYVTSKCGIKIILTWLER